jgi:hypothetical protein
MTATCLLINQSSGSDLVHFGSPEMPHEYSCPFAVLPSCTYLFTAGVECFYLFLDHTQTHTTVGRTPLDKGSARRRDLYLTTKALYKRQTSMPPVGFEPTIPASTRP